MAISTDRSGGLAAQALRAESRSLRISGLVLMFLGSGTLAYVGIQLDQPSWIEQLDRRRIVTWAAIAVFGTNLAAFGLFLVLAGLRRLSFRTNARARKGLLRKVAGVNLLLMFVPLAVLSDSKVWGESADNPWLVALSFGALGLLLWTTRLMVRAFRRGWRFDAVSADELMQEDRRPPVLYLRSFRDDGQMFPRSGWSHWITDPAQLWSAITAEQELAMVLKLLGPVIAIGKPGEDLPELGAARLYVADDEWQARVIQMFRQVRLVVIRSGPTASLRWELDQAARLVPLSRLVLLFLGHGQDATAFQIEVESRFGPISTKLSSSSLTILGRIGLILLSKLRDLGQIIYFHQGGPEAERIRFTPTWHMLLDGPYRPYHDPIGRAMRRVFFNLGLPWTKHLNRGTVVVLSFLFGMFSIHLFYLGQRRQATMRLLFFWTLVPLVLGWMETVRFALMEEDEFEHLYNDR